MNEPTKEEVKHALGVLAASISVACYYCGEPCEGFAGDPGRWPLAFGHRDNPGVTKWHHVRCVTDRLIENQALALLSPPSAETGERAAKLDAIALEFCEGAFKEFGLSLERIRTAYAPILRELLDHAVALATPSPDTGVPEGGRFVRLADLVAILSMLPPKPLEKKDGQLWRYEDPHAVDRLYQIRAAFDAMLSASPQPEGKS